MHFKTQLPWNHNIEVKCTGNLSPVIIEKIANQNRSFLPVNITLFYDAIIPQEKISDFLNRLGSVINDNLLKLEDRINNVFAVSAINISELKAILKSQTNTLPWAIYYGDNGGLHLTIDTDNLKNPFGAVPCRLVHNHAVSWQTYPTGNKQVWLTTARSEGSDWNWDSDIGHELFHASFAPIPLFAQSSLKVTKDSKNYNAEFVEPQILAKMTYLYGEIAVLTLRSEEREHPLGLAVIENYEELIDCLKLSHCLMPQFGFDKAISYCEKYHDCKIDFEDCDIAFLTISVLRAIKHLNSQLYSIEIPSLELFKTYD
jgi:hypothetical protein